MMGTYCHLLAGMSQVYSEKNNMLMFHSSCLIHVGIFDNACFVCSAQSKIGGLRKNEVPLQHPVIRDNQHVFLYILTVFGYVT